jgi:hypothetical protein
MSFRDKIDNEIEEIATKVVEQVATRQNLVTTNQSGAGIVQSLFLEDGQRKAKVKDQYGKIQTISLASARVLGKGDQVTIDGGFGR